MNVYDTVTMEYSQTVSMEPSVSQENASALVVFPLEVVRPTVDI